MYITLPESSSALQTNSNVLTGILFLLFVLGPPSPYPPPSLSACWSCENLLPAASPSPRPSSVRGPQGASGGEQQPQTWLASFCQGSLAGTQHPCLAVVLLPCCPRADGVRPLQGPIGCPCCSHSPAQGADASRSGAGKFGSCLGCCEHSEQGHPPPPSRSPECRCCCRALLCFVSCGG